jgi:isoaspartyl peptidase/L-asparaginase-like protein (Ntn-hydrolase superfamily)
VRNPIKAARKVLGEDRFVLLAADGADDFAEHAGLVMEGPDYFIAEWRWDLHMEHMPTELAAQAAAAAAAAKVVDRYGHQRQYSQQSMQRTSV